ncbi:fas-binding factor 1 homolog isoform X6 [Electrophorus electricus]|uniref:fas-binding factor 1 homolog isoform X6 n=1 Tax=Electrophorus electricus TaxID=8005 RepID=UPI0015CFFA4C|nr:fas-binding factor 1 homolog isoform X6 [Electrophorus electricus]
MASKQKKGLRGTIDDVLGDLLGDGSDDPPVRSRSSGGGAGGDPGVPPSRGRKGSLLENEFFSKLAEEAEEEDEGSDVSEADPKALLDTMKDIDDMDADLFGYQRKSRAALTKPDSALIKPNSAPAQSRAPAPGSVKRGAADPDLEGPGLEERKPRSAPAAAVRGYRKFSFVDDMRDDLGGLLDGLDPGVSKSVLSGQEEPMSPPSLTVQKQEQLAPKKRDELTFDDDDQNDLMDALGFSDTPKDSGLVVKRESEAPGRPRTRLDEILGIGTSLQLLQRPATGEKKDPAQPERVPPAQKPPRRGSADRDVSEEDFTFGLYQPTVGSAPEGHQSRRQSVRFSMEDVSSPSPEHRPKPSVQAGRAASDWLGLKKEDEEGQTHGAKEPAGVPESQKPPPSPPRGRAAPPARATSSAQGPGEGEEEEEDWLAGALSKSRAQGAGRSDDRLGEEANLASLRSRRNTTVTPRERQEDMSAPRRSPSEPLAVSGRQQGRTPTSGPSPGSRHTPATPTSELRELNHLSQQSPGKSLANHTASVSYTETQQRPGADTTVPVQQEGLSSTLPPVSLSADMLQLLLKQQLTQTQQWGLGASLELGSLQKRDTQQQSVDIASLQATITQLQGQVKSLQMEKEQLQKLLDSVQQRHTQDTELMENAHRAHVKLLEESASQREARVQLESQALAARLAEQERAVLLEQHQRQLAQCQLDRDRQVERLRDLQRKSILEMKEDYEEQLQRLQKLKDEEIDAVTSATSQTRSLAALIEHMEQFSRKLGDLACRVESTHENTAQGLALGARHRDEQLRVLQEHLSQQQSEMAEERIRLKEVIAKMETQLAEQQRALQQERWRVTAEQAKAESALRGLEEERRTMTQRITMEREELERAKSSLLEEQQAVMQHCAVERRRLATEWTQFHAQEKLRQERVEREANRAVERDAQREGSIFSVAQEQAEMTLRAGQLQQKEETLQRERENLDKLREDLEQEKGQLSTAALRLQTRAQEVESFSKRASERYEEGERALQEARQVEAEHQARLRAIHAERERLRKQEHSLQQERMTMTDHLKEVEKRHSLPINPFSLSSAPLIRDVSPAFASSRLDAPVSAPAVNTSSSGFSPELQATLALLQHTAEKDRDFLQDEQFFLETLKKAPYNTAFHTP